jgi:hypothetical protein
MSERHEENLVPVHDRTLLLHGAKRDEILTLEEIERYGLDSFADADYIRIYGMAPGEWYRRGIRLLGRTAVECTRDALGDLIGRDVAAIAAQLSSTNKFVAIDPFAGSCNTLYWILRHIPNADGFGFELDPRVFELSRQNIAALDRKIELTNGSYESLLESRVIPADCCIIFFIAPPWGTALDEVVGLDLRGTNPPITDIINRIGRHYADHKILFAIQVYEKVNPDSLADLNALLDWSELRTYAINAEGRNHGILLGSKGWVPRFQARE